MKNSFLAFASLGLLFFPFTSATASTIINWSGRYVSAYTPFAGAEETQGAGTYRRYSFTSPIAEAGIKFYGATSLENGTGTTPPVYSQDLYGIRPGSGSGTDTFVVSATASSGTLTLRSLLFVKKEDFLNGANNTIVTFDADSVLKLNVTSSIGSTRQVRCAVYALVNGEWNWYISYNAKAGTALYTFDNLLSEKWALFPFSDSSLTIGAPPASSVSYGLTGEAFEDIGAIGIFINHAQTTNGSSAGIYFNSLQVDAHFTAVPEASTLGMGLLSTGLLVMRLRLRKK